MATTRIKDISKTTTDLASDTYGVFDGATNGTQKMARNDMYADWAAAYVAAPTTYKLAPLNSGTNKIDATYLPTSGDTPKGEWNASSNSPALADGSGTAGDYYDVTTAGTQNLGSGSIAYTVGDVVKYNGSTWYKIDSVANILDGSATAADGRSTLSVNSIDEDAQANALKTTAPALYFNGSSSVVTVADDDKLTFSSSVEFGTNSSGTWSPNDNTPALTDGTGTLNQHYRVDSGAGTVTQGGSTLSVINGTATTAGQAVYYDGAVWRLKDVDDLPFSISAWVKPSDITSLRPIVSKYSSSGEYLFYFTSGKLVFLLRDAAVQPFLSTAALTVSVDEWFHVCVTYAGAGPNKANGFASAASGIKLFVNGKDLTSGGTVSNPAGYTGMPDTTNTLQIGGAGSDYYRGHIKDVEIFNRELTAAQVVQAMDGDLGFSDEWGDHATNLIADGDMEDAGTTDWSNVSVTLSKEVASPHGGTRNLKAILNGATTGYVQTAATPMTAGKRYRATFWYRTGGTAPNAFRFRGNGSSWQEIDTLATSASWAYKSVEFIAQADTNGRVVFYIELGTDASTYIEIDDFALHSIGTLLDARAERYDTSTNKLYDLSDNAFVGTGTSVTLTGREVPVYEAGTWTPTLTFGGGSTGLTYTSQEGFYTRIGNTVFATGGLILSAKGSSTGAAKIALPYTARNTTDDIQGVSVGRGLNMAGLTSAVTGYVIDNTTSCQLMDWGATGAVDLDEGNFTNTTEINISVTYQIS